MATSDQTPAWLRQYSKPTTAEPTQRERKGEADIVQSGASAASSAATAREKTATLPSTIRKEAAAATKAEVEAEQAKIALQKLKQLSSGRPLPADLPKARRAVAVELRNLVKSKELSKTMFGATGIGHSTTSYFSGSPAATVESLLKPVQANTAFEALTKMRVESPTGGALGNVTERELELLYSKEGSIDPRGDDTTFQQGVDDMIANRIDVLNRLGTDPTEIADLLGPDNIEQFAPMITAYRFLPEDEAALKKYVETTKANGTYDPTDYAALMAQAYQNTTGRAPDENYVLNALKTGQQIGEGKGASMGALDYGQADENARSAAITRAKGAQPTGLSFGEAIGGGALNLIPNTFEVAYDTVKALTVDLPDTIEGVAKIVAGATGLSDNDEAWRAVKDYYVNRYGSLQGFYKALREEPASILADVAGIATGGATILAKGLSTAGKLSKIAALSNAATKAEGFAELAAKVDPLVMAAKTTKTGANVARGTAETIGVGIPAKAAGVTTGDVKQAVQAGREGSPEFLQQMQSAEGAEDPIAKAQAAIGEIYQQRSKEYARRMSRLKKSEETLSFDDVEKAIEGVRTIGKHRGIDISSAADVWRQVDDKYMEFFDKGLNKIEDFDAMKRAIGNIRDNYQRGTPQYKVANDVVKAINNTISERAPIYADVMKDYRTASDVLSDVTASLSTGAKSADTTLNKLRRVASGKGPRGRTVLQLLESTQSGKGLGNMLAGRAMSGTEPAGLTPSLSLGAAMAAGSPEPVLGALLSPQRLGTAAYETGRYINLAERGLDLASRMPGAETAKDVAKSLYDRYAIPTAQSIRVANPALIQSQVSDFSYAPPSEEERKAALIQRYLPTFPTVSVQEPSGVSLESFRDKYTGPVLPVRKLKKDEEEPDSEETPSTGFAAGGRVIVPSAF